jgi:hypothetical protein
MSDSLSAGFSQFNVQTDHVFKKSIPSLVDMSIGLDQMGFDYRIKDKYQLGRPSGYDNIVDKMIDLLVLLRGDFMGVLYDVDDEKHPMTLEPIRVNKNVYEHDLFLIAEKMGDDVANAMTRSLRTQDLWSFGNSGFGRQVAKHLPNRLNTHVSFKHPIIYMDNIMFSEFSLTRGATTSHDDILRVSEDLRLYFRRVEPILNYIKRLNPRFRMVVMEEDQIDHEWYFPYEGIRYSYGFMITAVPSFKTYVVNKVKSLVDSSLKMGLNSTSEVASKLNDLMELQAMTAQSGNKVANFLNPDSAVRLTRSLLTNGLLSFTKTEYEISTFKEGNEVTLLDCMLMPLIAPYRLWDDLTITRCLNYLATHFFSALNVFRRYIPSVMERASEAPTPLLSGLEAASVAFPPVVPARGPTTGELARAVRDYFSTGSDGVAIPARLVTAAYVPVDRNVPYTEQTKSTDLPFHVSNEIQFQSFFEVQPEMVVDAQAPTMPAKWQQFMTMVDLLNNRQFNRGNRQNRNVVSILESLAINSDQYFVYASRIMDQLRTMSLYPHACVGEIRNVLDDDNFVMDNVAKTTTHIAEQGSLFSFIRMQNWDESLIEMTDTSFIQEGITDVIAMNDVHSSISDVNYLDSEFHNHITANTGRIFGRKRSRTEKYSNASKCLIHKTGRHQIMQDMVYSLPNSFKDAIASFMKVRDWTSVKDALFAYSEMFGFTTSVLFRPQSLNSGVEAFPALGNVRMFSSSTIAEIPGAVDYTEASDVANYAPLGDDKSYEFKFPYVETMFDHLQTFQMLKNDSQFRIFAIIDNKQGGTPSSANTVIDDIHNGRIPVINIGWVWKFETSLQMYKNLLSNIDFAATGTNNWFHYFVDYNSANRIDARAVNALGSVFINNGVLRWPNSFEEFSRNLKNPFSSYDHISLNMYKTNEFPVLKITA